MSARQDYIHGLRDLADRLARNPDCPLPYDGNDGHISVYAMDNDELRNAVKAIGGERVADDNTGFRLQRTLGGLRVEVVPLYGACERVPTGETRTVQREEIVTPAETRTVTEEVAVYETRCPESLLRPGAEQAADDDAPDTDAAAADAGALA